MTIEAKINENQGRIFQKMTGAFAPDMTQNVNYFSRDVVYSVGTEGIGKS